MARRLNYSPRFAGSTETIGHRYDRAMDKATWSRPPAFIFGNASPLKQEFAKAKRRVTLQASAKFKREQAEKERSATARREAEERVVGRVDQMIAMIKFSMDELSACPGDAGLVSQKSLVDLLLTLEKKCLHRHQETFAEEAARKRKMHQQQMEDEERIDEPPLPAPSSSPPSTSPSTSISTSASTPPPPSKKVRQRLSKLTGE